MILAFLLCISAAFGPISKKQPRKYRDIKVSCSSTDIAREACQHHHRTHNARKNKRPLSLPNDSSPESLSATVLPSYDWCGTILEHNPLNKATLVENPVTIPPKMLDHSVSTHSKSNGDKISKNLQAFKQLFKGRQAKSHSDLLEDCTSEFTIEQFSAQPVENERKARPHSIDESSLRRNSYFPQNAASGNEKDVVGKKNIYEHSFNSSPESDNEFQTNYTTDVGKYPNNNVPQKSYNLKHFNKTHVAQQQKTNEDLGKTDQEIIQSYVANMLKNSTKQSDRNILVMQPKLCEKQYLTDLRTIQVKIQQLIELVKNYKPDFSTFNNQNYPLYFKIGLKHRFNKNKFVDSLEKISKLLSVSEKKAVTSKNSFQHYLSNKLVGALEEISTYLNLLVEQNHKLDGLYEESFCIYGSIETTLAQISKELELNKYKDSLSKAKLDQQDMLEKTVREIYNFYLT